jgi:serine/threonine protein kinase
LGEGSFGSVELGRRKSDSSFVAIKTVYQTRDHHEKIALERELAALNEIVKNGGHPNLLSLYDVVTGSPLQIITELCSGGELFDKVVEDGRIEEKEATRIITDLAEGLIFLHEKCHYCHGDLKPENIMLNSIDVDDSYMQPKLVDFGSSHQKLPNPAQYGTAAYWPPEAHLQSPHGRSFKGGSASDMFALGIIYYIMLVGCHPYDPMGDATDDELRLNIISGNYNWPEKKQLPRISENIRCIVDQLLTNDEKKRYTASNLFHELSIQMKSWKEEEEREKHLKGKNNEGPKLKPRAVPPKSVLKRRSGVLRNIIQTSPEDGHRKADLDVLSSLLSDFNLKKIKYKTNQVIIQEGDVNDETWYLLMDGLVQVELKTSGLNNEKETVVAAQLRPGSFFGETSLLNNQPRVATIRAITPVEVVQLSSSDLDLLEGDNTSTKIIDKLQRGRSQVRIHALLKNAKDCPIVELEKGEVLFREGEEADAVYLIRNGAVDVIDETDQKIIVTLNEGELLGETAILTRLPRNATARVSSEKTSFLKVERRRFMNIIGTQLREELMKTKSSSLKRSIAKKATQK